MNPPLTIGTKEHGLVSRLEAVAFYLFVISVFLLPSFHLKESWPTFALSDLLFPFMSLLVLYRYGTRLFTQSYLWVLFAFAAIMILSITVNHRLSSVRDHFEVLKVIKLAVAVYFVAAVAPHIDVIKLLRSVFMLVLLFSFFQYTGLLNFNNVVEPYYASEWHVSGFGVNSLGLPASRRLLGTMGNPNNNSILFLFFISFFMPSRNSSRLENVFFWLAFLGCFFCQSRTGFLASIVIFITGAVLYRYTLRALVLHLIVLPVLYIVFMGVDAIYLNFNMGGTYLGSLTSDKLAQSNSVQERLRVWKILWSMIREKPLLGNAPYKEYFEENKMYPESEIVLTAWRYGFTGLLAYLASVLAPAFRALRARASSYAVPMILFSIAILITATTNAPLNEVNILMMFGIMTGLFFAGQLNRNYEKAAAGGN
jgi:O-antigen ligase